MVDALGMDIQSIDEIAASLSEFGSRYTRRLFTSGEIKLCQRNTAAQARCYAERFAAKEAVLKLLNVRALIPPWKDIEVLVESSGRLVILLHGVAADLAHQRGIQRISLDISHARGSVIAVVVARPTD